MSLSSKTLSLRVENEKDFAEDIAKAIKEAYFSVVILV